MREVSPAPEPIVALVRPDVARRVARLAPRRLRPWRATWTSGSARPGWRVVAAPIDPSRVERLRTDPLLVTEAIGHASNWEAWRRGEAPALELRPIGRRSWRDPPGSLRLRPLGPAVSSAPPGSVARRAPPLPRPLEVPADWRPRRSPDTPRADGVWVSEGAAASILESWIEAPEIDWSRALLYRAADGFVVTVVPDAARRPTGCVLVRREPVERDGLLWIERDLLLPSSLARAEPPTPAMVAIVSHGRVRLRGLASVPLSADEFLEGPASPEIVAHDGAPPGPAEGAPDLRSPAAAGEVAEWLEPEPTEDHGLRRRLSKTFRRKDAAADIHDAPGALEPRKESRSWRRFFSLRRLSDALREQLDRIARRELGRGEAGRRGVVRRQRDVLVRLLEKLSGEGWRDGVAIALPLRPPGEKEVASPWLNVDAHLRAEEVDFSLDRISAKPTLGVVGVGQEIYRQFRELYREAARRFLGAREYRRAAHVLSWLLGEHERAAAALEQGGFPHEAATVYYHLAERPRKAAVALERGRSFADAARIWMDEGVWRRAAIAWKAAGNGFQAAAAWRKVAMDLRETGRVIAAAEVLARELEQPLSALEILEAGSEGEGPEALGATERALRGWLALEDTARAVALLERVQGRREAEARQAPRRRSLLRLLEWVERLGDWGATAPLSAVVTAARCRRAWVDAVEAYQGLRRIAHPLLVDELDGLVLRAARTPTIANDDPWLADDAERWLGEETPAVALPARGLPVREDTLPWECRSLTRYGSGLLVGGEGGEILHLDADGRILARLDTGTGRPVTDLQAAAPEAYAAVDSEVHHFTDLAPDAPAPEGASLRPAHIERTIPSVVQRLLLFPDGSALLRLTARELLALHPHLLLPLRLRFEVRAAHIAAAAINRRHLALVVNLGRPSPDQPARFDVIVLRHRPRRTGVELRPVERFPVESTRPERIEFARADGDGIWVVGDEYLVEYPSARSRVGYIEMEVGRADGSFPSARLAPIPGRNSLLLAHGDGSVEWIRPSDRAREFVVAPPSGAADPVVGFALAPQSARAWVLHRSGRLRTLSDLPR